MLSAVREVAGAGLAIPSTTEVAAGIRIVLQATSVVHGKAGNAGIAAVAQPSAFAG